MLFPRMWDVVSRASLCKGVEDKVSGGQETEGSATPFGEERNLGGFCSSDYALGPISGRVLGTLATGTRA